jgi:hypothetical protein
MFILAVMLFWALLQRFITIVVFTIFSPIFFLFAAVPGYEGVMSTWFKRMAAAALCFPVMLVLIYIAISLVSLGTPSQISAPPPIGETGKIFNIGVLVGVGILMFSQKVPGFVDDMFGIKPGGGGRGGGGVGLGAVISAPMSGASTLGNLNRSSGALMGLTQSAQMKGGIMGLVTKPVYELGRAFSGNKPGSSVQWDPTANQGAGGMVTGKSAGGDPSGGQLRNYYKAQQASRAKDKQVGARDIKAGADAAPTPQGQTEAFGIPPFMAGPMSQDEEIHLANEWDSKEHTLRAAGKTQAEIDEAKKKHFGNS